MRENHKIHTQKKEPNISIGDVVLIEEEKVKRNKWRLGKVIEIVRGKDGVIRGAVMETAKEKMSRPLQKLYPLEVREASVATKDDVVEEAGDSTPVPIVLDTLTSQTTPKSKNERNPKKSSKPSLSSARSRKKNDEPVQNAVQKNGYSSTSSRPRRTAGVDGEEKRRTAERK